MRLLWAGLASSALAVFLDQAFQVDWQFHGVGVPEAAVKTGDGHVLLTDKNQLALVEEGGAVVWRRDVQAASIAVGNHTVYSQSDIEVTAWELASGSRLGSIPGGDAICADDTQLVVARGAEVFIYDVWSGEPQKVSFPKAVDALECTAEGVVGWSGSSAHRVEAGEVERFDQSNRGSTSLESQGVSVNEFGVVSTESWTRPEGLTEVVSACFIELESQDNKPELPALSEYIMENWTVRVKRHVDQLVRFRRFSQGGSKDLLFGFHKELALVTSRGSLYVFDTINRSIVWEKHFNAVSVENIDNLAVVTLDDGSRVAFDNAGNEVPAPAAVQPEFDVSISSTEVVGLINGTESWRFSGSIVASGRRDPREVTANVANVLGDNKAQYKYLNPNVVAVATHKDQFLSLTVLDGITGRTLYANQIEDPVKIDADHEISLVVGENWVVVSYFSEDELASPKLTILDLYESSAPNERLSGAAVDPFTDTAVPWVAQRTVVLKEPLTALGVSMTHFGVTRREVIAATSTQVFSVPKLALSALRNKADENQKGKPVAEADTVLEIPPTAVLSHERVVKRVKHFATATTLLESTFALCAYGGLDVFYTRVSPSGEFDKLPNSFEVLKLFFIVSGLASLAFFLRPLANNKTLRYEWA